MRFICFIEIISTCIPHKRTPNFDDVDDSHFSIFDLRFISESRSAYCLLPIFKSSIHGL
jgi:hypothetical protein